MQHKSVYVWGLVARFAPAVILLVTNMILTRLLTPQDFGTIGVLAIIYTIANTLIDSGLGGSLVKENDLKKIDCSTILTFNIAVSALLYFVIFLLSGKLEVFFQISGLSTIVKVLSLTIIISSFGVVPNAVLLKNLQFRTTFIISIISVTLASMVAIILAFLKFGIFSLVIYQILFTLTQVILSNILSHYKLSFAFSYDSFKKIIPFGIYTSIITIIDTTYENILTTLTGKYLNVKHAGYVSQSKRIDDGLSYSIAMTIGTVTFPILTKLKDDLVAFKEETHSIYKTFPLILFPLLMLVAVYSTETITLLFGDQWIESGKYLTGFMFAGVFLVLEALLYGFIKALCLVDRLALVTIIKRIIGIGIIVVTLIFFPRFVIEGYILSSLIGFVANSLLFCKISDTKLTAFFRETVIYIIPSCIIFTLMYIAKGLLGVSLVWSLVLSLGLIVIYYFMFLRFFGIKIVDSIKKLIGRWCI